MVKQDKKSASIAVELSDFSVYYYQDTVDNASACLGHGRNKIVVEGGQVIKDKDGIAAKEVLTKTWTDWIDYWSVDFDIESKREIIREPKSLTGEMEEHWTGDFSFENEWRSFRTKKDRSLELATPYHEVGLGKYYKVAVKAIDIVGNDIVEIMV